MAYSAIGKMRKKNEQIYLSDSSFLHIHDFAVALNSRYASTDAE